MSSDAGADAGADAVLAGLADGRSLPRSVLAGEAGLTPAATARHLAALTAAGAVLATARGRFTYYSLAPDAAALAAAAAGRVPPVRSRLPGTDAYAVRQARFCYGHLAGRAGVALTDALRSRGFLTGPDVVCCVDWTEQRHHLAGPLGLALTGALVDRGWVVRGSVPRSAVVTAAGRAGLRRAFGVELD